MGKRVCIGRRVVWRVGGKLRERSRTDRAGAIHCAQVGISSTLAKHRCRFAVAQLHGNIERGTPVTCRDHRIKVRTYECRGHVDGVNIVKIQKRIVFKFRNVWDVTCDINKTRH